MNNIEFPELVFKEPGVYSYTMKEHTTAEPEWITDSRAYRVIITVADTGGGNLSASVEYPDGEPVFINLKCKCRFVRICCCRRQCCCCCTKQK